VGQSLRLDSHRTSGETAETKAPAERQAEAAVIDEGPKLPLWARIAIGLERSFEQARSDLLKNAGARELATGQEQPAQPDIRTRADVAPASPESNGTARPVKSSFHAVIDAAIAELASACWKVLPGGSYVSAGDTAIEPTPPRQIAPIALAALASSAALAGRCQMNRARRRVGATHHLMLIKECGGFHPPYKV
jgi:hypothetical protein